MAELAASIISIVSVGTKVALVLSQLAADMGSAGKEARSIACEIRGMCAVLKTLHATLARVKTSPYFAHCLELTDDLMTASLEMYAEIIGIAESLRAMVQTQEGRFRLRSRVYWAAFQKPKVVGLRAVLEAYKSNLALMVGTLNIAEKAARPVNVFPTLGEIQEDEQDNALLSGLQLDEQAAIIDLDEPGQLDQDGSWKDLDADLNSGGESPANKSTTALQMTEDKSPLIEEDLLQEVSAEVESLRSSRSSFYSFKAAADSLSLHSQRLSQLVGEDRNRISRRWSKTLSDPRSSVASRARFSPISLLSALPEDTSVAPSFVENSVLTDQYAYLSMESILFHPGFMAENYFFSCFEITNFAPFQSCEETLRTLFAKYRLQNVERVRMDYDPHLFISQNQAMAVVAWTEALLPLMRKFTFQGKGCGLVLKRRVQNRVRQNMPMPPLQNTKSSSPSTPLPAGAELFKWFHMSIDDPTHKVLPAALKKYNIKMADWHLYYLCIDCDGEVRPMNRDEKPLIIFKEFDRLGKKPVFLLRKMHPVDAL